VQATKEGGTVVYSTCTFAPEENEAVLDYVLEEEACRLVDFEIPLDSVPGVTEWPGGEDGTGGGDQSGDGTADDDGPREFDPSVEKAKRIYPHLNDTGGFFCAKLEVEG